MKPILGKILLDKDWLFFCAHVDAKTWRRGFCLYFGDLQLECDKVQWLQTHCGHALFFGGKSLYKDIFLCVSTVGLLTLYIQELPYMNTSFECILKKKKRSYACTFPVQRKEINVVKINVVKCNTMRYSSRKLSHEKVITTTCNFWRQIACSFLVKRGNVLLLAELHAREARARGRSPIAK